MKKTLLILSAFALIFQACKKDETSTSGNNNTTNTCLLTKEIVNDTGYTAVSYDSQKRIIQTKEKSPSNTDTTTNTFKYDGNMVYVCQNGDTVGLAILNSKGSADTLIYSNGSDEIITSYLYNSDGNMTKSYTTLVYNGINIVITTVNTWTGGNLTNSLQTTMLGSIPYSSTSTNYEYYTDIINTAAASKLKSEFQGVDSKNAVKKATEVSGSNTTVTTYSYVTDSNGKTTQISEVIDGGTPSVTKLTWSCN